MCLNNDGRLYAASGKSVSVWSCNDLSPIARLETQPGAIRALAITQKYIITGTHNQNIHAYDIKTHQPALKLVGHVGAITWLLPSPGEKVHTPLVFFTRNRPHFPACVLTRHAPPPPNSFHTDAVPF